MLTAPVTVKRTIWPDTGLPAVFLTVAVTCTTMPPPATGSIFGQATIDGSGSHAYRIDVQDGGKGVGKYQIRLDTGYDSGNETLSGGQITIHK